jgi:hypothetical protein
MGILRTLVTLPIAGPVRGAFWLAAQIHEAASAEFNDPAAIRAALTELEKRLDAGEMDENAFEAEEALLLDRMEAAMRAEAGR